MRAMIAPAGHARAVRGQYLSPKSVALRNRSVRRGVLIFSALAVLALCYVWTRVRVIQLGYEATALHREVMKLEQKKEMLDAEVARLKTPERLERIARETLGMRRPRGDEIVFAPAE